VLAHFFTNLIDICAATCHGSKLIAQNCIELLGDLARLLQVFQHIHHVSRLVKELVGIGEIPSYDCQFILNLLTRPIEFVLPFFKHLNSGRNVSNCLCGIHILLEDGLDVDLLPHFLANLV